MDYYTLRDGYWLFLAWELYLSPQVLFGCLFGFIYVGVGAGCGMCILLVTCWHSRPLSLS